MAPTRPQANRARHRRRRAPRPRHRPATTGGAARADGVGHHPPARGPGLRPEREVTNHGTAHARSHRHTGVAAVPRGHDVRRLGQPRPRRLRPHRAQRARRRDQLRRHGRRLLGRRVRGDRSQGPGRGPARRRGAGDQGPRRHGGGSQHVGQLPALDHARSGIEPPAPAHRLDRPVPDPPARSHLRHRRDPGCADRSGAPGQGAGHRLLHVPGGSDRGVALGGRAPRARALRLRAAAVLHRGPGYRARRPAGLQPPRHGRHRLEPPERRMAHRPVPQGRTPPPGRPGQPHARALLGVAPRSGGQARRGGVPGGAGRRGRDPAHPPRPGFRAHAPGGDGRHHRPPDHGAPHRYAGRAGGGAVRRGPRPDRRHRGPRDHRRPDGRGVDTTRSVRRLRRRRPAATRGAT